MGGYVLVVKFTGGGGDYVLVVKFIGGGMSTYKKMSRGGIVQGGIMSVSRMVLPETHEVERLIERKNNHNKVVYSKLC